MNESGLGDELELSEPKLTKPPRKGILRRGKASPPPPLLNGSLYAPTSVGVDSGYYSPKFNKVNGSNDDIFAPASLPEKLLHANPSGGGHADYVPVIPVDRSAAKVSKFGPGAGYRLTGFFSMHFLTSALRHLEPRIDDDFVDRLNYYYTSTLIVMFAILVSAKQYVGHPIECWVPAQFTKAMEQYTENYCWVQNTYWVPFGDLIPNRIDDRERRQIGYYQWVPFILAIEALMFYIPATFWKLLNQESGINLHGILQLACNEHNLEPENRERTVNILTRHVDDALRYQRDFGNKKRPVYVWAFVRLGKYYGAFVSLLYCCTKLLYLLNVFGQFFLLNRFMETSDYPLFGGHVIYDLLQGQEWRTSGKFPRVTLCDFEIRVLGNIHRHTVQCVLVINMFTEKIFVFLWLWFLLLAVLCFFSILFWFVTLSSVGLRAKFVRKHLELSDDPALNERELRRFVVGFLRPDGVFILRMVCAHAGTILCTELTHALWQRFRLRQKEPRADPSDSGSSVASTGADFPTFVEKDVDDRSLGVHTMQTSGIADEPADLDHWPKHSPPPYVGGKRVTPPVDAPGAEQKPRPPPRLTPALPPILPFKSDDNESSHYV